MYFDKTMAAWIGWNSSESDSWALEIKHDWTAILYVMEIGKIILLPL
jgi:hypothetical protein